MALYRHNTVHTFVVGKFSFKNHLLSVNDADMEEFQDILEQLPTAESRNIVELNEDAIKNLERPAVRRGPMSAVDTIAAMQKQSESETKAQSAKAEELRLQRLADTTIVAQASKGSKPAATS